MKKWFHVSLKNRWGRGQPDDIGAINLGDEKFDPDSDKKPRAGQILWIRGLTRLQTQVTIPISLFSLYLSIYLSFSVTLSLSFSFSHYLIIQTQDSIFSRFLSIHENSNERKTQQKKKKENRPRIQPGPGGETTRVTYGPLETFFFFFFENSQDSFSFLFSFLRSFLLTVRARPLERSYARRT